MLVQVAQDAVALLEFFYERYFLNAGHAPCSPDVYKQQFATEISQFKYVSFFISKCEVDNNCGIYFRLVEGKNCKSKEEDFFEGNIKHSKGLYYGNVQQSNFQKIPNMPIGYWLSDRYFSIFSSCKQLSTFVETKLGMSTNDNGRFLRQWYETSYSNSYFTRRNSDSIQFKQKWFPYSKGGGAKKW